MKKIKKSLVGTVLHIGKPFESHDGVSLNNRFMCIFSVESDHLMLMPMSAFHSKEQKNQRLNGIVNFEYSKKHGNTCDAYIKCNQIYVLRNEDFNNFDEIKLSRKISKEHFEKLQNHVKNLQKDSKNKFFKTVVNFKDLPRTIKKEQINKRKFDDYER